MTKTTKRISRILAMTLATLLICMTLGLSGCGDGLNRIPFMQSEFSFREHTTWDVFNQHVNIQRLVRSNEELVDFLDYYDISWYYNDTSICEHYSDSFFEDSALVLIVWRFISVGRPEPIFDYISVNNDTLNLYVSPSIFMGPFWIPFIIYYAFEVYQEDVKGVEYINSELQSLYNFN